ncbi:MAG: peptidoglycan-associated lipoprotein [Acidobacteria bacterium RIFCSPLOWO2_12_FULL_65_11]|nr:MAG: peptidoglycan-associated lipoprotein [Acidobacteria bacterium RIFCSPLOWO2_02_FULL_64_15]OFW34225.1 MAG: peptidoglycan-associated lipoprotein [Acidobacteria bacterium RIFCSPLOWO2_12_FULL_65_11]
MSKSHTITSRLLLAALTVAAAGCAAKTSPDVQGAPSPGPPLSAGSPISVPAPPAPSAPPAPVGEPVPVPVRDEVIVASSLDDLNRTSPLQPVFFALDSNSLDQTAQTTLDQNAAVLRKHPSWAVMIEGHCDERGTAEYNLPLGERRAVAVRAHLISLGIPASQIQVVSYGKEFPFDPGHDEAAWAKNRRAHFVITAQ